MRPYVLPESLSRYVDEESIDQREGTLTTAVRGNQVHMSVRLRRGWAFLQNLDKWSPSDREIRQMSKFLRKAGQVWERAMIVFIVGVVIYLAIEVAVAFVPGGPVDRLVRGW